MALYEALGELVAAAILSAAPGPDLSVPVDVRERPELLVAWLRSHGDSSTISSVVDELAREIWVGSETRTLSQHALEQHVTVLTKLVSQHLPSQTHITHALERARTGVTGVGTTEPIARRIAVDVFSRARAAGSLGSANLKDDVALFLIDRVYAHLLDDPAVLGSFSALLVEYLESGRLAGNQTAGIRPDVIASWHTILNLGAALIERIEAGGGAEMLADLRERYGLSEPAMARILSIIDAQKHRPDDMLDKLEALAAWLGDARAQLLKPTNEDADIRRLKAKAAAALAEGSFEGAFEALRMVRRELREGRRRIEERLQEEAAQLRGQMVEEARASARLAELSLAKGDYLAAAELFSDAALNLPTTDRSGIWGYNLARAEALHRHGTLRDDAAALNEALAAYSQSVRLAADGSNQKGLGLASLGLGNTLAELAQRDNGGSRFKDAIASYRKALQLIPRTDEPRAWAEAQLRLARCLASLGERDGNMTQLTEAAQAFRDALTEISPVKQPADYASAHTGLGGVLLTLEEREGGLPLMEEAAASFTAALTTLRRSEDAAQWAEAQKNCGLALLGIGEQTGDIRRLEAARSAFGSALEVYTRASAPKVWALTQMNLGNVLAALAERDAATAVERLNDAIACYTAALEEFRRDSEPLKWAITQMNLGTALIRLGDHKDKRRHWLAAAGALVPALEVFEIERADAYADVTRRSLKRFHEDWEALIAAPETAKEPATRPVPVSKAG